MFGKERKTRRQWANRSSKTTSMRPTIWQQCTDGEILLTMLIVIGFWLGLASILFLRRNVIAYRPGQYISHDITARVDFEYFNKNFHDQQVATVRLEAEHVYRKSPGDIWAAIQAELLDLPNKIHNLSADQLDPPFKGILDSGTLAQLEQMRGAAQMAGFNEKVQAFIAYAKQNLFPENQPLVILSEEDFASEFQNVRATEQRKIMLLPAVDVMHPEANLSNTGSQQFVAVDDQHIFSTKLPDSKLNILDFSARQLGVTLGPKIARLALEKLESSPTYQLDPAATQERQNAMAAAVDPRDANTQVSRNMVIVPQRNGVISESDFQVLRAENDAYYQSLTSTTAGLWQYRLGIFLLSGMFTVVLCAYVARNQPKCLRNHVRALALAGLLLSSLAVTELAGIGSSSLYFFGIAPTILAAMILAIAYDQRFALGTSTIHAMMVTAALNLGLPFLLILWVGLVTACYLLDDLRTRGKLIEVGGVSAIAMMVVCVAVGASQLAPFQFIAIDCMWTFAAGLAAGFITLGILPFIERLFRITTSMTLLELADASQPLLRRLALEAPGTYNHSLQVATLSEAAAEAIGANGLLCRVGSYYHDIGKIKKPDYFIENQSRGESRHLNLSPTLSRQIIFSHVKDGIEIAKQENLPTSILPIIQQHHGTTLVEYFYHQAMTQNDQQADPGPKLSETEFRYPGPKPRSKEAASVMLSDAVESTARSMAEPTPSRIETLVHELAMKRLHDGQFDEVDLTLKDLALMEASLVKTLTGIYHGRVAYPSTAAVTAKPTTPSAETPASAAKSA